LAQLGELWCIFQVVFEMQLQTNLQVIPNTKTIIVHQDLQMEEKTKDYFPQIAHPDQNDCGK
jgi:hypothetical protein